MIRSLFVFHLSQGEYKNGPMWLDLEREQMGVSGIEWLSNFKYWCPNWVASFVPNSLLRKHCALIQWFWLCVYVRMCACVFEVAHVVFCFCSAGESDDWAWCSDPRLCITSSAWFAIIMNLHAIYVSFSHESIENWCKRWIVCVRLDKRIVWRWRRTTNDLVVPELCGNITWFFLFFHISFSFRSSFDVAHMTCDLYMFVTSIWSDRNFMRYTETSSYQVRHKLSWQNAWSVLSCSGVRLCNDCRCKPGSASG